MNARRHLRQLPLKDWRCRLMGTHYMASDDRLLLVKIENRLPFSWDWKAKDWKFNASLADIFIGERTLDDVILEEIEQFKQERTVPVVSW